MTGEKGAQMFVKENKNQYSSWASEQLKLLNSEQLKLLYMGLLLHFRCASISCFQVVSE